MNHHTLKQLGGITGIAKKLNVSTTTAAKYCRQGFPPHAFKRIERVSGIVIGEGEE
jgi:hypothetical protein